MNKQPEVTGQTRTNLLHAFWGLYRDRGLERITVKEIAAKAGYNRGTFYQYFPDTRACLEQIELSCLPRIDELPPLSLDPSASPDFLESFISLYQDKLEYYDVLLSDRGDPSFRRRLIESIKSSVVGVAPLRPAADEGEMDIMLEFILSGMIGIMSHHFRSEPRRTLADMVATIYRIMDLDMMREIRRYLSPRDAPSGA